MAAQVKVLEEQGKIRGTTSMIVPVNSFTGDGKSSEGKIAAGMPKSETNDLVKAAQVRGAAKAVAEERGAPAAVSTKGKPSASEKKEKTGTQPIKKKSTAEQMAPRTKMSSPSLDPMKLAMSPNIPRRAKTKRKEIQGNKMNLISRHKTAKFNVSCASHNRRRPSRKSNGTPGSAATQSFRGIFPSDHSKSGQLQSMLSMHAMAIAEGLDEGEDEDDEDNDDSRKGSITNDDELTAHGVDLEKRVSLTKQLGLGKSQSSVMPALKELDGEVGEEEGGGSKAEAGKKKKK